MLVSIKSTVCIAIVEQKKVVMLSGDAKITVKSLIERLSPASERSN